MGKWVKVTGREPQIRWARGVCQRHNSLRKEWRGGFYALIGESHLPAMASGFAEWNLKVEFLDGPPPKRRRCIEANSKSKQRASALRRRRNRSKSPHKRIQKSDNEADIELLGTTVADIRAMAFNHTKGEVAYLLGITTDELNQAFLNLDLEPIYFGYKCKRCKARFNGEEALKDYRTHIITTHTQSFYNN